MLRQFHPQDAPSCCRLIHACLENDPSLSPALLRKMRDMETPESMNERSGLFYLSVYDRDNQILGIAGLDMNEIRLLCVSPAHQQQGIGRELLDHLKAMVPSVLFADIFVYASTQATGFYKSCGFLEKGPYIINIGAETIPTVFMTLPL